MLNLKHIASYWSKKLFHNFINAPVLDAKPLELSEDTRYQIKIALTQNRIIVINYRNEDGDFSIINGKINRYQPAKNLLIITTANQQTVLVQLSKIKKIRVLPKETAD
ncbi:MULTISPECIES: hypothetical protein [unclassified Enterococcus]|uniref:hypothetical protein n=1 Tax=unclassified Enterococcus TaxID=2608891 RepID=UPI001551B156|nr:MULTISPECIES: hypothetical protein [unclassified Enterococcus]MBS7577884.1 hypothetical protein [Enterococcus sp. MMGLQ5-2]MBS7585144.1 hypothetical protein [Enterococcus sp. MMGLQ5-1]NPD13000.1 hypothetical protein [Enterococcus sp. MMGLQ5-1]NPD37714.1 hypothetical protein [Enterococcus sp. MMGLQ5-2]